MTWLTWRVERATMITAAVVVAVFAAVVVVIDVHGPSAMKTATMLYVLGPPAFATLIAVFWGAPMVAREYEQRTYLLLWSRERPAARWLAARVGHLLAPLLVLVIGVNLVAHLLQDKMFDGAAGRPDYDLWVPLQLATVVAGFGFGVLLGVLVRNSVLAMGITFVGYVALRFVFAVLLRPHLLPATRLLDAQRPDSSIFVASGYLDRAGHELSAADIERACGFTTSRADHAQCLAGKGVAHEFVDFQPADRIPDLRLVEFGCYAVLAVLVLAAAWLVLRRRAVA